MAFKIKAIATWISGKGLVKLINAPVPANPEVVAAQAANLIDLPPIPGFPPLPPYIDVSQPATVGDLVSGGGFKISISPSLLQEKFPALKKLSNEIDKLTEYIDDVIPDYTLLRDPNSPLSLLLNKVLCGFDYLQTSRIRIGNIGIETYALSIVFGSVLSSAFSLLDALRGKIPKTGIDCIDAELSRLTMAVATAVKLELINKTRITNPLNAKIRDLTNRANNKIREELGDLVGESTLIDITSSVSGITSNVVDVVRDEMDLQGQNAGNQAHNPFTPPPPNGGPIS